LANGETIIGQDFAVDCGKSYRRVGVHNIAIFINYFPPPG
jgi:hypothetical protein